MSYRLNIWSAMDGDAEKFGRFAKKIKQNRLIKLVKYWRRTH